MGRGCRLQVVRWRRGSGMRWGRRRGCLQAAERQVGGAGHDPATRRARRSGRIDSGRGGACAVGCDGATDGDAPGDGRVLSGALACELPRSRAWMFNDARAVGWSLSARSFSLGWERSLARKGSAVGVADGWILQRQRVLRMWPPTTLNAVVASFACTLSRLWSARLALSWSRLSGSAIERST